MRVLEHFRDLADGRHEYEAGDEYPREGYEPAAERIAELSGKGNARGVPLIEGAKKEEKKESKKEQ